MQTILDPQAREELVAFREELLKRATPRSLKLAARLAGMLAERVDVAGVLEELPGVLPTLAVWPLLQEEQSGDPVRGQTAILAWPGSVVSDVPSPARATRGVQLPLLRGAVLLAPQGGEFTELELISPYLETQGGRFRHFFRGLVSMVADGDELRAGEMLGQVGDEPVTWFLYDLEEGAWVDPVQWGERAGAKFLTRAGAQKRKGDGGAGVALALAGLGLLGTFAAVYWGSK